MLVMTAKVDKKKIAIVLTGILVLVVGLVLLLGGKDTTPTSAAVTAISVVSNDDRVQFLSGFGWEVTTSPVESGQVRIPEAADQVFDRYNALQKSQGYDLSAHAGQTVMRYVYKVNNYPGATEPVFATVLISKNQVIGGDVTNTAPKGVIQGFRMPESTTAPTTDTAQTGVEDTEDVDTVATETPTEPSTTAER